MINFAKPIKLKFITQNRLFSNRSIYKNVLNHLSVILEDEKRFYAYFKKKFPKSFKYLPIIKFITFLLILITLQMDYQTYSVLSSTILEEKSLILAPTKFYSQYSFCFYFIIIIYEYVLSIYVTLKANSPVRNVVFQIVKHTVKAVGATSTIAVGYSHAPVEPNVVSNFVHTRTPLGRGYDYEIGSLGLKAKGDVVSGALGNKDMISAAQKHAPDSSIIDINKLNNIVNDPEFKSKIRANTTTVEKVFLGIPLIDTSPIISNPVGSDVSDSNSLEDLSETNGDDNNTDESTTPVIKESPIRRHHSEPLPRRSNRPAIQRRNTR
jgi:hypothetical protein